MITLLIIITLIFGTRTPTTDPDYKLAVDGKIVGHDVIASAPTNWADFVFSKNYTLQSLTEVENYIHTHQHLPNIPSEKEVKAKGINMADMDAKLLQKIEELTLYIIEQNKRIGELEKANK